MNEILKISKENVLKAIEQHPDAKELLETLSPEVKEIEFYSGAQFEDTKGETYLVVHSAQYDKQYYLVNIFTGYSVNGISFLRLAPGYRLMLSAGNLSGYRLIHAGNRRVK